MDGIVSIDELFQMPIKELNLMIESIERQQQLNELKQK